MTAPFDHILLAMAKAEDADRTLETVIAIARSFSGQVTVLHARERKVGPRDEVREEETVEEAHRYAEAVVERLGKAGVDARLVVESVRPDKLADLILTYADATPTDLIVIGGHHPHNLRESVFGDIGKVLAHGAHCPVMLMPSTEAPAGTATGAAAEAS